jgi:hypothetical protein
VKVKCKIISPDEAAELALKEKRPKSGKEKGKTAPSKGGAKGQNSFVKLNLIINMYIYNSINRRICFCARIFRAT